jgi:transcriptional regulator with XRE-family HTH domain
MRNPRNRPRNVGASLRAADAKIARGEAGARGVGEQAAFGELLRRHRLAAGLTQEALAERTGLSVRGLSDLERGARRMPHPGTVRRLAQALEQSESEGIDLQAVRDRQVSDGVRRATRAAPPSNLPAPLARLVGRERELAEIRQLLEACRLFTLVGPVHDLDRICRVLASRA